LDASNEWRSVNAPTATIPRDSADETDAVALAYLSHPVAIRSDTLLTLYTASYKAFCRRNGKFNSDAIGDRHGNEELLAAMNKTMASEWRLLRSYCKDIMTASAAAIQDHVHTLTENIQSKLADYVSVGSALKVLLELEGSALFVEIMQTKEVDVKYKLAEEAESVRKQLAQALRANLCRKDNEVANNQTQLHQTRRNRR